MEYLLSCLIGYLAGSFPTAYLLLKRVKKLDITEQGSGNVGAMNTFDVTKSKILGAVVLIIDLLKGIISVYLTFLLLPHEFIYPALALFFAVFSHCYNPWLKLKGGRGLATTAGGTLIIFPALPLVWIIIWIISYLIKRDIIFSNVWATVMTIIIFFTSINIFVKYSFPQPDSTSTLLFFSVSLTTIIFIKHIEPLLELFNNKKFFSKVKDEQ